MTLLNEHRRFKRDNCIKKLVSNARAIISNQIALPLGASKMTSIISWINQIEPISQIDLKVFFEYQSKTINLPLGTERLTYNLAFFKQLDELTGQHKDKLIENCFEIIATFGDKRTD